MTADLVPRWNRHYTTPEAIEAVCDHLDDNAHRTFTIGDLVESVAGSRFAGGVWHAAQTVVSSYRALGLIEQIGRRRAPGKPRIFRVAPHAMPRR
jgi:hypothetical protein